MKKTGNSPRKRRDNFYEDVYEVVRQIPQGRVTTYGAIARYLGTGNTARMVGYALRNAVENAGIPAHRVVNHQGLLTGRHHFPPGRSMETCLAEDGVAVSDHQVLDFNTRFWDPQELD